MSAARPFLRRDRAWHGSLPTVLETGGTSGGSSNSHSARPRRRLQFLATGRLTTEQEGLRILPSPQILKEPKSLYQALWSFRLRLTPELELIQVLGADLSFAQPFEQVLAQSRWKVLPPYPRHQSPKVRRASSSLIRSCSAGSLELVSRSASCRNRLRSASWASSPDSTNSAMTRLVLARFARASVRTLRATPAERVTLCRNGLAELGMLLEYTTPHHSAPSAKRNNSGAEGYSFEPYRAYQLTRDAASYSHSTARITLAERRGRFPDPRDAGTSRCLVIRALNNRPEGQRWRKASSPP